MSKFKILWIDDQPEKIGLEKDNLEKIVEMKGFTPKIELISQITSTDLTNADWYKKLKSREYDLLLIDFNLCNHILGSSVIGSIRKDNNIYVDIIFYSSDRDKLISTIKNSFDGSLLEFLDDVHIAILDDTDFYDKIESIIDKIIGSWYNAHSIRGVILAKTSKFETMVNEIVRLNYLSKKDVLSKKLTEKKKNVEKSICDKWDKLMNDPDPALYVTTHPVGFNWNTRKLLFNTLVDEGVISITDSNFSTQLEEIFTLRNDFAHSKAKIINGEIIVNVNGNEKIYNESAICDIRTKINNIEGILESLLCDK